MPGRLIRPARRRQPFLLPLAPSVSAAAGNRVGRRIAPVMAQRFAPLGTAILLRPSSSETGGAPVALLGVVLADRLAGVVLADRLAGVVVG